MSYKSILILCAIFTFNCLAIADEPVDINSNAIQKLCLVAIPQSTGEMSEYLKNGKSKDEVIQHGLSVFYSNFVGVKPTNKDVIKSSEAFVHSNYAFVENFPKFKSKTHAIIAMIRCLNPTETTKIINYETSIVEKDILECEGITMETKKLGICSNNVLKKHNLIR